MNEEVAVLKRWFLPSLLGFTSVKELFNALDECNGISVIVDTPIKEYILNIHFTGRERGIPLHHPDFPEFEKKGEENE